MNYKNKDLENLKRKIDNLSDEKKLENVKKERLVQGLVLK